MAETPTAKLTIVLERRKTTPAHSVRVLKGSAVEEQGLGCSGDERRAVWRLGKESRIPDRRASSNLERSETPLRADRSGCPNKSQARAMPEVICSVRGHSIANVRNVRGSGWSTRLKWARDGATDPRSKGGPVLAALESSRLPDRRSGYGNRLDSTRGSRKRTAMNPIALLLAFLVAGCGRDLRDDLLRPSSDLATSEIALHIHVEGHEAFGEEVAHTHVSLELYGYDKDGYSHNLELSGSDQLTVSVDQETTAFVGVPFPSKKNPFFIRYAVEIPGSAPGTELSINFDRQGGSVSHQITLPELTGLEVTPVDDISVEQNLLVRWAEIEGRESTLTFSYHCDVADQNPLEYGVTYPNKLAPELKSPFTFHPDAFFSLRSDEEIEACELTTRLWTAETSDRPADTEFMELIIDRARSEAVTHNLVFEK